MTRYANLGGDSGVVGYDIGPAFIVVHFQDGSAYRYSDQSAGQAHIATMHRLAEAGQGLNAYINTHVTHRYESKLR